MVAKQNKAGDEGGMMTVVVMMLEMDTITRMNARDQSESSKG